METDSKRIIQRFAMSTEEDYKYYEIVDDGRTYCGLRYRYNKVQRANRDRMGSIRATEYKRMKKRMKKGA